MSQAPSGSGYFISPDEGPGPGVLLLHSFWGLDRDTKDTANRLADAGFTVMAPDLADGETYDDEDTAMAALADADINVLASLVQSSVGIVRNAQHETSDPIGLVGFGSGASWALWLSARLTDHIGAVVTYYGTQTTPMDASQADYLCHWADEDPNVSADDQANLGLSFTLAKRPFRFEHHADTTTGFAERSQPGFDVAADAVAWRQTIEFLANGLAKPKAT